MNFDETPPPFKWLKGKTYDFKGVKSVDMKTDRGGWTKRQATLILYIFTDRISQIPPKLIFHGTPIKEGSRNEALKGHLYHLGVTVHFNDSAYNNEQAGR